MNNSGQDKTTVYLIIALVCLYFLLDDFFGKARITNLVGGWFSGMGPLVTPMTPAAAPATAPKTAPAAKPATAAEVAAANKVLLQSQQDTGNLATGTVTKQKPATKPAGDRSWLPDFSLPSSLPHFDIPAPPAWLGGIPALL